MPIYDINVKSLDTDIAIILFICIIFSAIVLTIIMTSTTFIITINKYTEINIKINIEIIIEINIEIIIEINIEININIYSKNISFR